MVSQTGPLRLTDDGELFLIQVVVFVVLRALQSQLESETVLGDLVSEVRDPISRRYRFKSVGWVRTLSQVTPGAQESYTLP